MTRFALALSAAAGTLALAGAALAGPVVGKPAPAFAAKDDAGRTVSLADFKGKTVVLEWTNDGCPYVGAQYRSGSMQATQKAATAEGVSGCR